MRQKKVSYILWREFGDIRVELTNPDKILYPETGTTKQDVVDYYLLVAPAMLPHIAGRPVTRKRWPDGTAGKFFFEKNLPVHAPSWIHRRSVEHSRRRIDYPIIDSPAGLAWLAQQAALELHVPQWRCADGGHAGGTRAIGPVTRLVFDLDPGPGAGLADCADVAIMIRDTMADVGMRAFPVTSGSKGIHVYAPLDSPPGPGEAAAIAKQVAVGLAGRHPDRVTAIMAKSARAGKVFVDWSQNNSAKTTIAPYSLRGRNQPTVAAPRSWDELSAGSTLRQLTFEEVQTRVARAGDVMADMDALGSHDNARLDRRSQLRRPGAGTQLPRGLSPMLATPGQVVDLSADEWAFEVKWDGFRLIVEIADGDVVMRSRSGRVVTDTYPQLTRLAADVPDHSLVLDGEIVVFDETDGAQGSSCRPLGTNFRLLQAEPRRGVFIAFDVLYADGVSLLRKQYADRRRVVETLARRSPVLVVAPILDGEGSQAVEYTRDRQLEGVVAKRWDSVYMPGKRLRTWVKQKNWRVQRVVIGGWRAGTGVRSGGIGSLLVGVDGGDRPYFAGRVGTGLSVAQLTDLSGRLGPLRRADSPFAEPPGRVESRDAVWVDPVLHAEIRFYEWTDAGRLRHPSFIRLVD